MNCSMAVFNCRWIQVRMDFITNTLVLITSMTVVYLGHYHVLSIGAVGLVLTYGTNVDTQSHKVTAKIDFRSADICPGFVVK